MASSQPHGVMAPTSSASMSLQMEQDYQFLVPNLQILLDFLGLESIDSRVALEKLHLN